MKIIFIKGVEDYDAFTFEEEFKADIETWNEVKETRMVNYTIEALAFEFGDVDEEFVYFVKNKLMDYDSSKNRNFYIVE